MVAHRTSIRPGLRRITTVLPWCLGAVVVLTPLPEGSALPTALIVLEAAVFAILAVSAVVCLRERRRFFTNSSGAILGGSIAAFFAVVVLQIVPMPPALLARVSPRTYQVYRVSLPGWPDRDSYPELRNNAEANQATANMSAGSWRTLSLSPSMSVAVMLRLICYAAILWMVGFFTLPDRKSERRFVGILIAAVLLSGFLAACIGIVEFFTWNGRILWVLKPYDWGASQPEQMLRASGSFVNPDHFGDYLAIALIIGAGELAFGVAKLRRSDARAARIAGFTFLFVVVSALLLSVSRGAWLASGVGLLALILFSRWLPSEAKPRLLQNDSKKTVLIAGCAALAMLLLCVVFIGQQGREQLGSRLQETADAETIGSGLRLSLLRSTGAMFLDHPVLGVGLGIWPEALARYERVPVPKMRIREAHNDYSQVLAELGVIGFAAAACFLIAIVRLARPRAGSGDLPTELAVVRVAICGALVALVVHEFFDFSLHTPANGILAAVLLGLLVRISIAEHPTAEPQPTYVTVSIEVAVLTLLGFVFVAVFQQDRVPFPYNVRSNTLAEALRSVDRFPGEAAPHLALTLYAANMLQPQARERETHAAMLLAPLDSTALDIDAHNLMEDGDYQRGLDEISRSVELAPSVQAHPYLRGDRVYLLSDSDRAAIEKGFRAAIARQAPGAADGLAEYDARIGRYGDAAAIHEAAAEKLDDHERYQELRSAALDYLAAKDNSSAERVLLAAIRTQPAEAWPYRALMLEVYGPEKKLDQAQQLAADGIEQGADASQLDIALGQAALRTGDDKIAELSFQQSIAVAPSYAGCMQLGMLYLNQHRDERAALAFDCALNAMPGSAEALFARGVAEERAYKFDQAESDLRRARDLAPGNSQFSEQYASLERLIAENRTVAHPTN